MSNPLTLLEKAKTLPTKRRRQGIPSTEEELDLLIGVVRGEVSMRRAAIVLGITPQSFGTWFIATLRYGIYHGKFTLTRS